MRTIVFFERIVFSVYSESLILTEAIGSIMSGL